MTIREMIIQKRTELGMTQAELSRRTGITQARISEFEKGTRQMMSSNIDLLFEALDIKFYKASPNHNWGFAGECAHILKEKGVTSVDKLTKEDLATLCDKPEFLSMKEYGKNYNEEKSIKQGADPDNSFDYIKSVIAFKLAVLK